MMTYEEPAELYAIGAGFTNPTSTKELEQSSARAYIMICLV